MNDDLIYIDPPSGWKYGFPKAVTLEEYNQITNLKQWCIDNGYPLAEADSYGDYFYVGISGNIHSTKAAETEEEKLYTKEEVKDLCITFFNKGTDYGVGKTIEPDYYMYIDSPLDNLIKSLL